MLTQSFWLPAGSFNTKSYLVLRPKLILGYSIKFEHLTILNLIDLEKNNSVLLINVTICLNLIKEPKMHGTSAHKELYSSFVIILLKNTLGVFPSVTFM